MSDIDNASTMVNLSLIQSTRSKRHRMLTVRTGRSLAGEIIATQEIDLYQDHLPTMARTAIAMLRSMYEIYLDASIEVILEGYMP